MAMDLNAKAAYIRGLMTGMEFDPASKNGKVIAAMMESAGRDGCPGGRA